VITGVVAFSMPKRRGRHLRWGERCLRVYTLVFLTATILPVERWSTDAYLFYIAVVGLGIYKCPLYALSYTSRIAL